MVLKLKKNDFKMKKKMQIKNYVFELADRQITLCAAMYAVKKN